MQASKLSAIVVGLALAGCGGESAGTATSSGSGGASAAPPLPWPATAVPPVPAPTDNPGNADEVDLGRMLFYDPILSSDKATACATCHSEEWGMADGMQVSIGVGGTGATGPGRTGPSTGRRNALTIWNTAYRGAMFWDGRSPSLEDQILGPLGQAIELNRAPADVVADLATFPGYVSRFAAAFPEAGGAITVIDMQRAIASFERTLVSSWAPYDQYVAGDPGSLSADAQQGMFRFAEAGCATCHVPPLFQSDLYANRNVPPIPGVSDQGRYEVTHDPADMNAYRVPSLRNIRETGPYFHTGAVMTLDDAVRHEVSLSGLSLSDTDIAAIVTFLDKGLIDPSRSPNRPADVPSGLPVPVDGFRIPR